MEDVSTCMEHFYKFECESKEYGKHVERWLVEGQKQDISQLQRDGLVKVNRGK